MSQEVGPPCGPIPTLNRPKPARSIPFLRRRSSPPRRPILPCGAVVDRPVPRNTSGRKPHLPDGSNLGRNAHDIIL